MKRRTLDIMFSVGGLALAGLLLVLGLVLTSNANFAKHYVHDQLAAQKITFKTADTLTDQEKQAACLVKYAGQDLVTGKQAECYANEFIALHMAEAAKAAGYEGFTYATLGTPQSQLRTQAADAQKNNAANAEELQTKLTAINGLRDTMFRGETLRGLLLTSFGFSVFGVKGETAATVCYIVAALLFILSVAGLIHAFMTPKTKAFAEAVHEPVEAQPVERDLVKA